MRQEGGERSERVAVARRKKQEKRKDTLICINDEMQGPQRRPFRRRRDCEIFQGE